jgi:hypothetical protein
MSRGFAVPLSRWQFSAHTGSVPDEEDRPRDASSAADSAWSDAAAPDDIRELAEDIQAYHRECRAARRRALVNRFYDRPGAAPISATVAMLALAAIVATLLIFTESGSKRPSALPLASTTAAPGQVRGLLPDATVRDIGNNAIQARSLRPAVMAVIGLNCGCQPLLDGLAGDAAVERISMAVVAPGPPDAEAAALSGRINHGTVYYDTTGALHHAFSKSGVTVVLVNRDGTIFHVQTGVSTEAGSDLVSLLPQMLHGSTG